MLDEASAGEPRRPPLYFQARPAALQVPTPVAVGGAGSPMWNNAFNASACFSPMNLGFNSPMNFPGLGGSPGGPLLLSTPSMAVPTAVQASVAHQNSPTPPFYQVPRAAPMARDAPPAAAAAVAAAAPARIAGSAFHQSTPIHREDGTPSPLFSYAMVPGNMGSPLLPGVSSQQAFAPATPTRPPSSSGSLRRSLLIRQQQMQTGAICAHASIANDYSMSPTGSACSVSSGDESSSQTPAVPAHRTGTVPSKTPLPDNGDTMRIDPRHQHHYERLVFAGLHGASSPLDRIRVWSDGVGGPLLYDCVCGKRIPNTSLHKVKRHAYRHAVSSYTCDLCGKVFKAHWSLNAHKRIHKIE
ncbi:C2H2-type domain-containing protein [Plasmodiophora brassicae]